MVDCRIARFSPLISMSTLRFSTSPLFSSPIAARRRLTTCRCHPSINVVLPHPFDCCVRCRPRRSACSHNRKWLLQLCNGARTTVRKIIYFFGGSVRRRKRNIHPADAIVGEGRVGRGLMKGGGSCWGGRQRCSLWRTRGVTTMRILSWRRGKMAVQVDFCG